MLNLYLISNQGGFTMNKEKKESKKSNQERIDACDYLASAASSMDCTGLIPSAPTSRAELVSISPAGGKSEKKGSLAPFSRRRI